MRSSLSLASPSEKNRPALPAEKTLLRKPRSSDQKSFEHTVKRSIVGPTRTRGYVLRAFPSVSQAHRINQFIGQDRYLYNWLLDTQNAAFKKGISLHTKDGKALLNRLITEKLAEAKLGASRVLTHPGDPSQWGEHWLHGCPRTLITQKYKDLTESWKQYFKHTAGRPKFQKYSSKDSFRFQIDPRQYVSEISVHFGKEGLSETDPKDIWVKIPNVGSVRVELHEPIHGKIILVTVRRRPAKRFSAELFSGKPSSETSLEPANTIKKSQKDQQVWHGYEIVLTAKDIPVELDRPKNWAKRADWEQDSIQNQGPGLLGSGLGEHDPAGVIALDMSVSERAITSNGDSLGRRDKDPYTKARYDRRMARIKRDQRVIARKRRVSQKAAGFDPKESLPKRNTWTDEQKAAMRPSARQQVVANRVAHEQGLAKKAKRHDADVFTTYLVLAFHTIVVEGLTLKGMARGLNKGFRRGFNEAAMGEVLRILTYKCELYGRTLVVCDKWFPSSKKCYKCGYLNKELTLSDRVWTCTGCKTVHDRDDNATQNLKQEGCAAVGISLNAIGQQIPDTEQTAGELPVAGRRGLELWIGCNTGPCSTLADEASIISKPTKTTRRGLNRLLG
jgi:IS605 OrfB family transposase